MTDKIASSVLSEKPIDSFRNFLSRCNRLGVDTDMIRTIATNSLAHLRGNAADRRITGANQELEQNGYTKIRTKLWNNRPSLWISRRRR